MHRRRFLAFGSAALLPALGGCGETFDPVESKKQLGDAPGINIEVEPDREYEYLDESDEIRFGWSGETKPMDEWGVERAADEAADAVQTELDQADVLETGVGVSSGTVDLKRLDDLDGSERPSESDFERSLGRGVVVRHVYHYERDGVAIPETCRRVRTSGGGGAEIRRRDDSVSGVRLSRHPAGALQPNGDSERVA